jgi:protein tyrosine/serine phosphatase
MPAALEAMSVPSDFASAFNRPGSFVHSQLNINSDPIDEEIRVTTDIVGIGSVACGELRPCPT